MKVLEDMFYEKKRRKKRFQFTLIEDVFWFRAKIYF